MQNKKSMDLPGFCGKLSEVMPTNDVLNVNNAPYIVDLYNLMHMYQMMTQCEQMIFPSNCKTTKGGTLTFGFDSIDPIVLGECLNNNDNGLFKQIPDGESIKLVTKKRG